MVFFRRRIEVKSPDQLALMRTAGQLVASTLAVVREAVAPGVTPRELDALAERHIRAGGGVPSFLGYHGFPASICTSVNAEVVHGIPGDRPLEPGDLLSVDCGAIVDGWHGDAAITVPVGDVAPELLDLAQTTEDALWAGLAAATAGARLSDISAAVERAVRESGDYGIVEGYYGHGIGTSMHQHPDVANFGRPGRGPRLAAGNVLAIEPMVTLGTAMTDVLDDGWTVVSEDGSVAAHVEHTVAVTPRGPWVLTAADGGAAKLADLGVSCGAPS